MSGANRPSLSQPRSSDVERIIATAEIDTTFAGKKNVRYRGRRSTWPGALGLVIIAVGSLVGLTYYGMKLHDDVKTRVPSEAKIRERFGTGTQISDGRPAVNTTEEDINIVNPEEYEDKKCEQPNYVSKNGKIFAVFKSGQEIQLDVKGVNWLGMQDNKGVPKGLWDNTREGSTLYRIGQFLQGNNFNMVRLALSIDDAARNTSIATSLINTNSNRALTATRYIKLLGQISQGLGNFGMGVVLNFQVLSSVNKDDNSLWYGPSIQLSDIKLAITNIAQQLCNGKHFNIVGIDLKDGIGKTATWGDGSKTDWAAAATELGNHLVSVCPKWLAFVGGVQGSAHKDEYEGGRSLRTRFFAGSDLSVVDKKPLQLDTSGKVVYAPKYWTSSYSPQQFFFDSAESSGDMLKKYKESSMETLRKNVVRSMTYSFGPALESGNAVVLSSFGGLMGEQDLTAMKTSTRIIEILIDQMLASNKALAGGFWYTLNPETYWPYPAPDNSTGISAGLLYTSWREANMNILKGLKKMDKMASVSTIPCVV